MEQQKLAENKMMGHAVIRGVAGSGKTSVGVARIPYLLERFCIDEDKVLFVTYNKSLIKYVQYLYEKLENNRNLSLFASVKQDQQVVVKNIDAIMIKYFMKWKKENHQELELVWSIPSEVFQEAVLNIKERYPKANIIDGQNYKFLHDEMTWIKGCNIKCLAEYQEIDRLGRMITSGGEGPSRLYKNSINREAIYSLMEEIDKLLMKQGKIEGARANVLAFNYILTHDCGENYKHIIIDEAQDLTKVQLQFLNALKKADENSSILFLMDVAQSIYPQSWLVKGRSFKSIGYDMTGRSSKLSKNYRTTTEISECAYSLLAKEPLVAQGDEFVRPMLIERHGEYPVYRHFSDSEEQNLYIVRLIKAMVKQGYALNEIAVVAKFNKNLRLIEASLKEKGVESLLFNSKQDESFASPKVKLLTMHSIKGLEFKIVIVADLNEDIIPFPSKGLTDEEVKEEEILERKLLYVAMTRAQQKLFMCSYGKASKFMADIDTKYLSMQTGSRLNAFYDVPYEKYLFKEEIANPNQEEEAVRQWLLQELIDNYGYPKELIALEYKVKNFSQMGKVDVAIINARTNKPYIFVETKKETVPIKEAIEQLMSYMNVQQVDYGIATNGKAVAFLDSQLQRIDDIPVCNARILPSSVESYRYIDFLGYGEKAFERDLSAMEVYVAEELQKPEDLTVIKVYSEIAAGKPIEIVDETRGSFPMPKAFLHNKRDVYMLQVKGDSMIGAGIDSGDQVVIEQADSIDNQQIGAVYYNGGVTLKRVIQMGDTVLLMSENPKYEPIHIEGDDYRIMGRLIGVIKTL